MELEEISERLKSLDIPVAYLKFDAPQKLPFCAFFEAEASVEGADNYDLYRRKKIVVELYTKKKDVELERKFEKLFREFELEKAVDTFLKDENMFMAAYTFEIIQKMED